MLSLSIPIVTCETEHMNEKQKKKLNRRINLSFKHSNNTLRKPQKRAKLTAEVKHFPKTFWFD